MVQTEQVIEYKCPCCGAPLAFDQKSQNLTCGSCGNEFEIDAVKAFNEPEEGADGFSWEEAEVRELSDSEKNGLQIFTCPSCGGQLLTDDTTAATFCPYCENPAIIPGRVSSGLRPDGVLPFLKTKEDAKNAFAALCQKKPLLPNGYYDQQRLEKISGVYVPFWLYDCAGDFSGRYRATRVKHWSDSTYRYTRTSHYLLARRAKADFSGIPMDGSSKMDDSIMESIEPFDYNSMVEFDTAYLSGFLADRYDVESKSGENRIRQRVEHTMKDLLSPTFLGYTTVIPTHESLHVDHSNAKYVLLPVWMLTSRYNGKTYTFAMNGQTGRITGDLPICPKRSLAWFSGVAAAVALISAAIMLLV
jgi:DNA-directed RNA polymerase subunit RPC12/RpoP